MNDNNEPLTGMALAVLEEQADATIRRAEIDGVWYFSVIDVIAIPTDSDRPRKYWSDLKSSMKTKDGWSELSANLGQLKLQASDGKYYRTDAADPETMLRIIQSVSSPKAEPVKLWLARVGSQHLEATTRPIEIPVLAPTTPIAPGLGDGQTGGW
jgi:hypothetical protein